MQIRTDLALEAALLAKEGQEGPGGRLPGVRRQSEEAEGMTFTRIVIENAQGAHALGRPQGRYVTAELPPLTDDEEGMEKKAQRLGSELKALLPPEGTVLVVGLGNESITPDAGAAGRPAGAGDPPH